MSSSRFRRDPFPPRRADDGRPLCRWCGGDLPPRRSSWCSDACGLEAAIRRSASVARHCVGERDRGVCALCGLDTKKARAQIREAARDARANDPRLVGSRDLERFLAALFVGPAAASRFFETGAWWQADHVLPVVEGGGACGLENLRTLCTLCHKAETRELARRRAESRRSARS